MTKEDGGLVEPTRPRGAEKRGGISTPLVPRKRRLDAASKRNEGSIRPLVADEGRNRMATDLRFRSAEV
jgi:hypothetical protein